MRTRSVLLLCAWLLPSMGWAQRLSVGGEVTFRLDTPQPAPLPFTEINGSGDITVTCSPCVTTNQQHFGFDALAFHFVSAPSAAAARRVSGVGAPTKVGRWPYVVHQLPPGSRLYPRLEGARCWCGNLAETSEPLTVEQPQLAFTVSPVLQFVFPPSHTATAGQPLALRATCLASPRGNERVRLHAVGAGVDVAADFAEAGGAFSPGLEVLPTRAGPLAVSCSLEPYGARSNVVMFEITPATPSAPGEKPPGEEPTGCTSAPGPSLAVLALLWASRRRRAAPPRATAQNSARAKAPTLKVKGVGPLGPR